MRGLPRGNELRLKPDTRPEKEPLKSGDWRLRLLRHHVPLASASAIVLGLFMTVPTLDANAYPHVDIFTGAFPQQRERSEDGPMNHGAGESPRPDRGHGAGESPRPDQGHGAGATPAPDQAHGAGATDSNDRPSDSFLGLGVRSFTVATGYVATGLLALTLLIGPLNLLLRRRTPVSSYLRRDVGTWTAIASVVHVAYGLQVHGQISGFLGYFVASDGSPLLSSFGLGNWTGLAATVIVVGLLALSSNFALRKLKAGPWKRLQRLNYALFVLVLVHAFFYGAVLRTTSPYTLILGLTVVAVLLGQAVGVWLWRRRYSRVTPTHAGAAR